MYKVILWWSWWVWSSRPDHDWLDWKEDAGGYKGTKNSNRSRTKFMANFNTIIINNQRTVSAQETIVTLSVISSVRQGIPSHQCRYGKICLALPINITAIPESCVFCQDAHPSWICVNKGQRSNQASRMRTLTGKVLGLYTVRVTSIALPVFHFHCILLVLLPLHLPLLRSLSRACTWSASWCPCIDVVLRVSLAHETSMDGETNEPWTSRYSNAGTENIVFNWEAHQQKV